MNITAQRKRETWDDFARWLYDAHTATSWARSYNLGIKSTLKDLVHELWELICLGCATGYAGHRHEMDENSCLRYFPVSQLFAVSIAVLNGVSWDEIECTQFVAFFLSQIAQHSSQPRTPHTMLLLHNRYLQKRTTYCATATYIPGTCKNVLQTMLLLHTW